MRHPDMAKCETLYNELKLRMMSPEDISAMFCINKEQTKTLVDTASIAYPIYEERGKRNHIFYGAMK